MELKEVLEAREKREVSRPLSERVLMKARQGYRKGGPVKYLSKKMGSGGRYIYKYRPGHPKQSLHSKQVEEGRAQKKGEEELMRTRIVVNKLMGSVIGAMEKDDKHNLHVAVGQGMKVPSFKKLAEEAWESEADMLNEDYKDKREVYRDVHMEAVQKMTNEKIDEELTDMLEVPKEELKKMSRADKVEALTENDNEMADDMNGSDILEMMYKNVNDYAKENLGRLGSVLAGYAQSYMDTNGEEGPEEE